MKIGEIESGIPVPIENYRGGLWTRRFKKMKLGQSFPIETDNSKEDIRRIANRVRASACKYRQRHEPDFQYAVRVDPEDKDKLRFWRLG